uniref:Gamma-secretase subunit APH-1 n=1 Tax=Naja naja TaxID=35670 RepID=A0A8C7E5C0_NAJNA
MGASVVFGCSFVAFGPALALCLLTMAGDPLRVLTLVAGKPSALLTSSSSMSGLFFGIISGLFSIINILADSIGPGTVGIHGDSPYYFITSAFLIMALVFLHTFRGTIFFSACEKRHYWKLALAIVSHLVISGLTFLNPCYEARLIPIFLITICRGVGAFFTAGGSLSNILACLSCREKEDGHVMVYSELQLPVGDR